MCDFYENIYQIIVLYPSIVQNWIVAWGIMAIFIASEYKTISNVQKNHKTTNGSVNN